MPVTVEQIRRDAQALNAEQFAELLDGLLVDAAVTNAAWEAAWAEECRARFDAYKAGTMTARSLDDVLMALRR